MQPATLAGQRPRWRETEGAGGHAAAAPWAAAGMPVPDGALELFLFQKIQGRRGAPWPGVSRGDRGGCGGRVGRGRAGSHAPAAVGGGGLCRAGCPAADAPADVAAVPGPAGPLRDSGGPLRSPAHTLALLRESRRSALPPMQRAPGLGPTGRSNVGCLSGGTGQARRLRSEVQAFRSGLCRKSREQGSRGKARGRSRMAVGAVTGSGRVRRRSEVPAASACTSVAAQRVWGAACGRRRARETRVGVSPVAPMALSRGDSLPHSSGAGRVPHTEGCFMRRLAERGLCRSHLTPHPRGPPRLLRFVPKSQSGKSGFQSVRSTFESWKRRCRSAPTFDEPAPLPLWPPRPPGPRSAPRR